MMKGSIALGLLVLGVFVAGLAGSNAEAPVKVGLFLLHIP